MQWLFILLPLLLWPMVFILLSSVFIYAMLCATIILSSISYYLYKGRIKWHVGITKSLLAGVIGAVLLYMLFYVGYQATIALGMQKDVGNVYAMIYGNAPAFILFPVLAIIGICEEIYWRGGMQVYLKDAKSIFMRYPWIFAAFYYGLIHLSTLNIILVGAAMLVGILTNIIAYRYGILASIITHVAWIWMIVIFIPIGA